MFGTMKIVSGLLAAAMGLQLPASAALAEGEGASTVEVRLETDDPRVRIDVIGSGGKTSPVCFAPCLRLLDSGSTYIIRGEGIRSTFRFTLPDDQSSVSLKVRAGTDTAMWTSLALLMAGGLALNSSLLGTQHRERPASWVWPVALTGAGLMAAGGLVYLFKARTRVSSSSGRSFSGASRKASFALAARGLEF